LTLQPFSLRHGKALKERRIRVSMSEPLRNRLWATLQQFNHSFNYQPDPNDNWNQKTDIVTETKRKPALAVCVAE
jgi:hypothetical protein